MSLLDNSGSNFNQIQKSNLQSYKSHSAYCQQHDIFTESLTVFEHLTFHAKLRNITTHQSRVKQVIKDMQLSQCQNLRIGSNFSSHHKTLSGGEKKRLTFATYILSQPSILFADEPTSGLDSSLAHTVVKSLKQIAKQGTTVLCTIHQPSSDTFDLFDKVLLLDQGQLIYFGLAGSYLLEYFSKSLNFYCPSHHNPADFIISMAASQNSDQLSQKFYASDFYKQFFSQECGEIYQNLSDSREHLKVGFGNENSHNSLGAYPKFKLLFYRCLLENFRIPKLFITRILQTLVIGILLSVIYYRDIERQYIGFSYSNSTGLGQHDDIVQINGAIFAISGVCSFNFLFYVLLE